MDNWGPALRLLGVGFFIGFLIIGGTLGGLWLDGRFETRPIFTLIGLFTGLMLAFWGVFQMLLPLLKNNDKGGK